ncbi:MAG: M20/M25/M40 family metallo-hydrolase [Candidatus Aminicenantes bacterium]|nr:M20/M25/M40 family metallo-hydrolase [Candidatus Aminicenantes bacterium]
MKEKSFFKINQALIIILILGCLKLVPGSSFAEETSAWNLLKELVLLPGVSTREERVADFILSRIPSALKPQKDEMGNVWFTVGNSSPHLLFIAHLDELGFFVQQITPHGTLKLRSTGGFLLWNYEGGSVTVWTKKGEIEGVVRPRKGYLTAEPAPFELETLEVDVGADTQEEAQAMGIQLGDPVTIRKRIIELSPDLRASRAVDDRAGCAALLAAALKLNWAQIKGKKITFAWSVQEEVGLRGAAYLAEKMSASYVFAIDTFVSTDSPLENHRFGLARVGGGAVIRAIDSSTIVPHQAMDKVIRIASARTIPLQWANSRGGNDGSVFVPRGAVNIPLAWPGAYAHTFIEKIHRQDLEALTELIMAIVQEWQ